MPRLRKLCGHDQGFTVVELVVAMTLLALVIGLGYSGARFAERRFVAWQRRTALDLAATRILAAISRELRLSPGGVHGDRNRLEFFGPRKQTITYESQGGRILRNRRNLLPPVCEAGTLAFTYLDATLEPNPFFGDSNGIVYVRIRIALTSATSYRVELVTGVTLRNRSQTID